MDEAVQILRQKHPKHRSEYEITYSLHEIYLDDDCHYCYHMPCICIPEWKIFVSGKCSICGKFAVYKKLDIYNVQPDVKDFI